MDRVRRAMTMLVLCAGVLPFTTACQGAGQGMGAILNLVIGVGVAVGTYYLVDALK